MSPKWKHFARHWPFVRGIDRSPVDSPQKGQWRGAFVFSLICTWTNGWVNNRDAGDLRRLRAHYDVTVMDDAKQSARYDWEYEAVTDYFSKSSPVNETNMWQAQVHGDVMPWKCFLHNWPFVKGIHRSSVHSPHKRPVRWSLDVFLNWKSCWSNCRVTGDQGTRMASL